MSSGTKRGFSFVRHSDHIRPIRGHGANFYLMRLY